MGSDTRLRTALDGGVLTVTLDRAEVLNAVDATMAMELRRLLEDAEHDDAVRAIVLTGAGRGFCAGADVADLVAAAGEDASPAVVRQLLRRGSIPLATQLLSMEKPLVAAVNGPCAGAGLGLALACDVIVAAESASFSVVFVRRGLVPDYGVTWLLPRLVGLRVARELALLGDTVDATGAERLGLVSRVVADATVVEEAQAVGRRFAEGAGVAIRLTKRLLSASFEVDPAMALDREFTAQSIAFASADALEGATSFLEKRPPRFTWR